MMPQDQSGEKGGRGGQSSYKPPKKEWRAWLDRIRGGFGLSTKKTRKAKAGSTISGTRSAKRVENTADKAGYKKRLAELKAAAMDKAGSEDQSGEKGGRGGQSSYKSKPKYNRANPGRFGGDAPKTPKDQSGEKGGRGNQGRRRSAAAKKPAPKKPVRRAKAGKPDKKKEGFDFKSAISRHLGGMPKPRKRK